MSNGRSTFIRDQLEQHADAVTREVGIAGRAAYAAFGNAARGQLVEQLVDALEGGLPLCGHLTTQIRATWAPGMPMLGCKIDLVAYVATLKTDRSCDICGAVPGPEARADVPLVMVAAGPVAVLGHLCPACLVRPTEAWSDPLAVRRQVLDLVEEAYWRAAGDGPGAA